MTIGLVQASCGSSQEENISKAEKFILRAVEGGADLVCLQELFSTQYFCQEEDPQRFELAEKFGGELCQQMAQVAKQHGIVLIAPYFEKRAEGIYHNSAAVIDADGSILGQEPQDAHS